MQTMIVVVNRGMVKVVKSAHQYAPHAIVMPCAQTSTVRTVVWMLALSTVAPTVC